MKACQELEVKQRKRRMKAYPERIQPPDSAFGLNSKAIAHTRLINLEGSFPSAISIPVRLGQHGCELLFTVGDGAQDNLIRVSLAGNQQSQGDGFSQRRIGVGKVIGRRRVQHMRKPGRLRSICSNHKG